MVDIEMYSRM